MPATSQNLYFHLVVNADDDGIVEAYSVLALTKANEDDLRVLVSKQFVFMVHVANILNRIVDANLRIKNMASYLISSLYTESMSGTIGEQAELHDDYLKYLRGNPYSV